VNRSVCCVARGGGSKVGDKIKALNSLHEQTGCYRLSVGGGLGGVVFFGKMIHAKYRRRAENLLVQKEMEGAALQKKGHGVASVTGRLVKISTEH